eukprot:m.366113 g.366113  ORF g.366113 m.366113 type:complete len:132 (+) comp20822_c0_seq7:872-1267(+)
MARIPPMISFVTKSLPKLYASGQLSEHQYFADHDIATKIRQDVDDEDIGPFWIDQIHEQLQQWPPDVLFDCWRATIRNCAIYQDAVPTAQDLRSIRAPTLIVHGDADAIVCSAQPLCLAAGWLTHVSVYMG